jgi:hypothetical protein
MERNGCHIIWATLLMFEAELSLLRTTIVTHKTDWYQFLSCNSSDSIRGYGHVSDSDSEHDSDVTVTVTMTVSQCILHVP